ncbi:MAG: hypothetical protein HY592_02120 [Candidatus Omnitrophica bacterium]|nr:hypothetical protein [Candidatus Omnitrophota bacterium]
MFKVNIVHISDKVLHEGESSSVIVPGVMGEFEVGIQHAPVAALLMHGKIAVRSLDEKNTVKVVTIRQGLMRFDGKELYAVVE